jgi:hypothetical protein
VGGGAGAGQWCGWWRRAFVPASGCGAGASDGVFFPPFACVVRAAAGERLWLRGRLPLPPTCPPSLSRCRALASLASYTLGTGLCGCCAFTVATVTLFIPGQWTRFDSVESRLVLLIRLINHTSHPSLHLVVYHARLYISTLKSNCIKWFHGVSWKKRLHNLNS